MKALICIFHKNPPQTYPNFRILWEYFKTELLLWKGTFDKLYLVDNGFGFTEDDLDWLRTNGFKYHIEPIYNISVEKGLNVIFEKVKEEYFLLIHSDTFIYNPDIINNGFKDLEKYDLATIFDGSGKRLSDKFPILQENEFRKERSRFCNYLWFGKMSDMNSISCDFTCTHEYPECASYISEQLLEKGIKVKELQDDRSNILYDGKEITSCQWLDDPSKIWGAKYPLDLGYHHARNFSQGFEIVNDFYNNKESFHGRVERMPLSEILRILAWEKSIADKIGQPYELNDVIVNLQVPIEGWNNYLEEFKKFYPFL